MELEEAISTETRMKTELSEVKEELRHREDDNEAQSRSIAMLESEKFDLMEALASRDDMLTSRLEEIGRMSQELEEAGSQRVRLEMRCVELEEAKDRWEGQRLEAEQRLQAEIEQSKEAVKPLEELQAKYQQLNKEHETFKSLHQEALDKSKLYDTDILDKYTKIKELKIERDSLQGMLQNKNQQLSQHFCQMEAKDQEITTLSNDKKNLEFALKTKEDELANLQTIISSSDNVSILTDLQQSVKILTCDLEAAKQAMLEKDNLLDQVEAAKCSLEEQLSSSKLEAKERLEVTNDLKEALDELEAKLEVS
jgi:chromosome segregation ATPase